MTLLDATPVDYQRLRRRRLLLGGIALLVVLSLAGYLYWPRYVARRTVTHFMDAIQRHNYQMAYFIWQANPREYSMDRFMQDWGPSSSWGTIKTFSIDGVESPGSNSSGLVVFVKINGRHDEARLWVERKTHELSFYEF